MRIAILWMVVLGCCTSWAGPEGTDTSTTAGERSFGDGSLPEHLAVYDVDASGTLSVEEIQAMKDDRRTRHEHWVTRWDANGDGVIDQVEEYADRKGMEVSVAERWLAPNLGYQ